MMRFFLAKSYLSYIAVGLAAFIVGSLSVPTPHESTHFSIPEIAVVGSDSLHSEETGPGELTFEGLVVACGSDGSGNRVSTESFMASDGQPVVASYINGFRSKKSATQRFKTELIEASEVIDRTPDLNYWGRTKGERAIFKKEGKILLVTLTDDSLTIVQAPTIRHILDFEKQRKSLSNSNMLNRLN